MAFFFTDNPIALFLALVIVIAILKTLLSKHKWFAGNKQSYVTPILIVLAIFLIAYRPLLRMVSFGLPFLLLVILFLFGLAAIMYVLGMPYKNIWPALNDVGPLKVAVQIAVFCIIAFAASHVYGEKLLEDKSVSLSDAMMPAQDSAEIDFAPIFTKQALGLGVIIVILGLAFVFINFAE
jgi:hypothetical protein